MGPGRETVAELVSKHFTVQSFAFHTTGLVAATSLIGDPINCDEGGSVKEDHCWIHGANRAGVGSFEDQKHFGCVLRTVNCDENGANCEVSKVCSEMKLPLK